MATPLTANQTIAALRAFGCTVSEVPGWRTVDRPGEFNPHWCTIHHTGSGLNGRTPERYIADIINGDPKTPAKANAVIDPDGVVWLNAIGNSNHQLRYSHRQFNTAVADTVPTTPGTLDWRGGLEKGSLFSYGVEIINGGVPTERQRAAAVRWAAAIAWALGWNGAATFGHGEGSDDRDASDPGLDMGRFRADVVAMVRDHPDAGAAASNATAVFDPTRDADPDRPTVSLAKLIQAATSDPDRPQGGTTPGAVDDVRVVESALVRAGLLAKDWALDGSFGSRTVEAYGKWQVRATGAVGSGADGIPGLESLTKLGDRFGFAVVA